MDESLMGALMGDGQPSDSPAVESSPAPEAQTPEVPTSEVAQPEPKAEEPRAVAEEPTSKANKRIRELVSTTKELKAQLEQQRQLQTLNQGLPWQQKSSLEGKDEITIQDFEQRADEIAELKFNQKWMEKQAELNGQKRIEQFASQIEKAVAEFPQFNPDSPEYDAEQDEFLQEVLIDSGAVDKDGRVLKPEVDVHKLASKAMKIWKRAETKGASTTTAEMARNMANSANTPDASHEEPRTKERIRKDALAKGDIDGALHSTLFGD